jgi:hypothetical protein
MAIERALPAIVRDAGRAEYPTAPAWQHGVNIVRVFAMSEGAQPRTRRSTLTIAGTALSHSPRLSAGHQVRAEKPNDQRRDGDENVAIDVLSMVEEVSINHFVGGNNDRRDQQPDSPMGNEVLPHFRQLPVLPTVSASHAWSAESAAAKPRSRSGEGYAVVVAGSGIRPSWVMI